jgi:hypothetical protein
VRRLAGHQRCALGMACAMKLIYRTLWPEDKWLQARYGRADWRMRLRHVFDAARGKI